MGGDELEVRRQLVRRLRRHLDRPGIGQHPALERLLVVRVHRAADPDLAARVGHDIPDVGGGQLLAVAEVVHLVHAVGHARVDGDPLNPGLQIRVILVRLGDVHLRLAVEAGEVGQLPLRR